MNVWMFCGDPAHTAVGDGQLVCGESYDHDLRLIDERDGYRTYECRGCGAEIVEEPEDDEQV